MQFTGRSVRRGAPQNGCRLVLRVHLLDEVMNLNTQVLVASASVLAVFFGASEAWSYRQSAKLFTQHEMRIQQGEDNKALLAALMQEKQLFQREAAAMRLLSGCGAVVALSVAVNLLVRRRLSRPINMLRDRLKLMSRGTWTQPIPVERHDEVGRLIGEFNLLGPRLTFAAHQYAAASKLAAMALIGQRVTRRVNIVKRRVVVVEELLSEARYLSQIVPQAAVHEIAKVAEELTDLAADLESQFNDELVRQGLPVRSISCGSRGASKTGAGQDKALAG